MSVVAQIRFGGVAGSTDALVIDDPVQLDNASNTGVSSWEWTLVMAPLGSSAVFENSGTTVSSIPNPVFTPDVAGTYLVRLRLNGTALPDQANARAFADIYEIDQRGGAVLTTDKGLRIPAAGETIEFSAERGWATPIQEVMGEVESMDPSVDAEAAVDGHESAFDHTLLHTQGSDTALATGTVNEVTAVNAKSAVDLKHTQGSDTALATGTANEVTAANAKSAVDLKHPRKHAHDGADDHDPVSGAIVDEIVTFSSTGHPAKRGPKTVTVGSGAADSGKVPKLDSNGRIDPSMVYGGGGAGGVFISEGLWPEEAAPVSMHVNVTDGVIRQPNPVTIAPATTISFAAATSLISDSGAGFGGIVVGDWVSISGAVNAGNNGTFLVTSAAAGSIQVATTLTDEAAGATITVVVSARPYRTKADTDLTVTAASAGKSKLAIVQKVYNATTAPTIKYGDLATLATQYTVTNPVASAVAVQDGWYGNSYKNESGATIRLRSIKIKPNGATNATSVTLQPVYAVGASPPSNGSATPDPATAWSAVGPAQTWTTPFTATYTYSGLDIEIPNGQYFTFVVLWTKVGSGSFVLQAKKDSNTALTITSGLTCAGNYRYKSGAWSNDTSSPWDVSWGDGADSLVFETPGTDPAYPDADAYNIELARIGTVVAPILPTTTGVAESPGANQVALTHTAGAYR